MQGEIDMAVARFRCPCSVAQQHSAGLRQSLMRIAALGDQVMANQRQQLAVARLEPVLRSVLLKLQYADAHLQPLPTGGLLDRHHVLHPAV